MKKFLLIVVLLIALAAGVAAVFISSIDWNEHKAKISEQFSAATGKKVVFSGPVELKFFPSPYLTVQDIKIYSEKSEIPQPLAEIKRLVVRLELVPFLKGEFNVQQMTLEQPTVRMKILDDGSFNWAGDLTPAQKQRMEENPVKLDNLSIEKATLTFYDAKRGIDWKFDNLSAEIMADSLLGPYHIEGSYVKDNNPAGFAFSIGRITDNMNTSISAALNNPASQTTFRFDGSVLPKNDVITGSINFESKRLMHFVTDNFKNFEFDKQYDMPLAVATQVNTNKQKIEFSNLVVKYGTTAAAGNVIIPRTQEVQDWNKKDQETPRQKVELAFNLTDFDLVPVVAYLKKLLQAYDGGKILKIAPQADIIADIRAVKAQYGKQDIKNLELSFDILPGRLNINKLQAQLAGNTDFRLKASLSPDEEGKFLYSSDISLRSDELIDLLRSFKLNPPLPVPSIYRKFTGSAKVEGSLKEIKITPLDFTLDKTKVAGDIAVMRDGGKLKLFVIAEADSINFDNYVPPLPDEAAEGSLEDKLRYRFEQLGFLQQADIQFLLSLGLGIYDNLPFEKTEAEGKLQNGVMEIKQLEVPSVSGGSLSASGKVKGFGKNFEFENLKYKFESPDIFSLLSKFAVELPDWELKDLKKFTAEGIATGSLARFAVKNVSQLENIDMSFGGVVAKTNAGREYNGKFYLKSPDFLDMLRRFKINYAPNVYSLGVFTLNTSFKGTFENFDAEALAASIGQNRFNGSLHYALDGEVKKVSGLLKINKFEPERFFYNGESSRINKEVVSFKKADGEKAEFLAKPLWQTVKVNYDFYKNLALNLEIAIEKLVYENIIMQNSAFKLVLADNVAKLSGFGADYNKGKINADMELAFKTNPLLKGKITLSGVSMDDGFWAGEKYGFNYGELSSSNSFSADAASVEEMVKTLEAVSEFEIKTAEFKGINLAAIEADLSKRTDGEGLSKLVRDNLESGKTDFASISGRLTVGRGDYSFSNVKFVTDKEYNLQMTAAGNLLAWDVNAGFSLGFKGISLPPVAFSFKGPLSAPQPEVNVSEIVGLYQRKHDEIAAKKQAEEQAYREKLQKDMNEQMSIAKAMEARLNTEVKEKFKAVQSQVKNKQTAEELKVLGGELENIGKGLSEVLTLGLSPKFEQKQIDDAGRRNGLLQKRIDKAEAGIVKYNVDDIKYRTNLLYNQIADIHAASKNKLNAFKSDSDVLKGRLAVIETDYSLENDSKAAALNAVVESLFMELDDINTALSRDYVQMQNTLDPLQLGKYEAKITESLEKAKQNRRQLEENIAAYYAYAEPQVAAEEQAYQEKLRQEEIERKLKENTGKISVAGAGKSMTVTRDIEDIEKSETLTEQEKIPVLDFSSKGNENVIIKQGDKTTVKKPESKEGVLRRTDGKISRASGVIVRK